MNEKKLKTIMRRVLVKMMTGPTLVDSRQGEGFMIEFTARFKLTKFYEELDWRIQDKIKTSFFKKYENEINKMWCDLCDGYWD